MTLTTFCASAFNLAMSGCSACAHNGAVKTSKSPISSRFIKSPRSLSVLLSHHFARQPLSFQSSCYCFNCRNSILLRSQHRGIRCCDQCSQVLGLGIELLVGGAQVIDCGAQIIDPRCALVAQELQPIDVLFLAAQLAAQFD